MDDHRAQLNDFPDDLPDSHRGLLDESTITSYIRDLTLCAENIHVRLKTVDGAHAQENTVRLEQAFESLMLGNACGAQIRYTYQSKAWADTITATARGLEITRLELPHSTPSNITPANESS